VLVVVLAVDECRCAVCLLLLRLRLLVLLWRLAWVKTSPSRQDHLRRLGAESVRPYLVSRITLLLLLLSALIPLSAKQTLYRLQPPTSHLPAFLSPAIPTNLLSGQSQVRS